MKTNINESIQAILDEAVEKGDELGCQVTVYYDGELIVDAWSGYTGPDKENEVDPNTIFPIFSTGKAIASTAKRRGAYKGRKKSLSDEKVILLKQRVASGEIKSRLAKEFGISRETLYQYLKDC